MPYTIETDHLKDAKKHRAELQNQLNMYYDDDGTLKKLWDSLEAHHDEMMSRQKAGSADEDWKVLGTGEQLLGY